MKGLLHSKVFRANLYKWLFMYIGVLGLLTTVITYSKYISSFQSSDQARAAKFNVKITYDNKCENSSSECYYGELRPTQDIEYYFTVDTTELEVTTLLVTNIKVNDDFTNVKLYDVTDEEVEFTNYTVNGNDLIITETIKDGNNYIRKYKLTTEFDSEVDEDYKVNHKYSDALVVGYSAIQIK